MLSIAECKKHLKNKQLTDEQVESRRDLLYKIARQIVEKITQNDIAKTTTS